ncbi:MAG: hypothetical protein IKO78_04010 [Bacilli bacterium]|nr:hypothetical protein [Bacilli bacterium]
MTFLELDEDYRDFGSEIKGYYDKNDYEDESYDDKKNIEIEEDNEAGSTYETA